MPTNTVTIDPIAALSTLAVWVQQTAGEVDALRAELAALRETVTHPPTPAAHGWLDTKAARAHLGGISENTLRDLAHRGLIERRYLDSKPLYHRASLDEYLHAAPAQRTAA